MHRPLLLLCLMVMAGGCGSPPLPALTRAQRDLIQQRTTNHFEQVMMFKPREESLEGALVFQLAPLLLQEVGSTNSNSEWVRSAPLKVSVWTNTVTIHAHQRMQVSYVWSNRQNEAYQGVRITLDARGAPVIWEILNDATRADVIFVSQFLEVLAGTEFGTVLPERKFAVERNPAETGLTVVAKVIDDGPVPMGPILYLAAAANDVVALICRCMPTQFGILGQQQEYELQLMTATNAPFSQVPLEKRLRLPSWF